MLKTAAFAISVTAILSGCATTSIPTTRKLSPDMAAQIGKTDVVIAENGAGVRAGWTSAGAAPTYNNYYYVPPGTSPLAAGVGAGIGQAIAIAILDAAPSARARKTANAVNANLDDERLDMQLKDKIAAELGGETVSFGNVDIQAFDRKSPELLDALKIVTSYTLAEDASAVMVQADVSYSSLNLTYKTPYDFGGKIPKNELKGPLYRNTFTYHSDILETPPMSDDVRENLVIAIKAQYDDEMQDLEAQGLKESKFAKKSAKAAKNRDDALNRTKDDKMSKTERAILLVDNWRGNDSPALMQAVSDGQDFIAKMLVQDLNNSAVPQFDRAEPKDKKRPIFGPIGKEDFTEIETDDSGRTVYRVDSGFYAGAYHSVPAAGFAPYGNTFKVAEKNR
ncbi:MAG: hypothetical protein ABJO36_06405 [Litorimonas sp.]